MGEDILKFDLIVIGGGPAGVVGATTAASMGKKVALVDSRAELGGAGANTGTVPSKTLRETALALSGARSRGLHGVDLSLRREATVADFLRHEQQVKARQRGFLSAHRALGSDRAGHEHRVPAPDSAWSFPKTCAPSSAGPFVRRNPAGACWWRTWTGRSSDRILRDRGRRVPRSVCSAAGNSVPDSRSATERRTGCQSIRDGVSATPPIRPEPALRVLLNVLGRISDRVWRWPGRSSASD
jgi:hypothetical protein